MKPVSAIIMTTGLAVMAASAAAAQTATVAPANAPSSTSLLPAGEPGTPLKISGTVVTGPDRKPVAGASIYVYQTDAGGLYDKNNPRDSDHPRLKGYLRTDAQGRYGFTTIRPGSYPNTRNPGHIHYHVLAPGHAEKVFEIVFEGDPLIPAQWLKDATNDQAGVALVKLNKSGDGLAGVHDVVLRSPAR